MGILSKKLSQHEIQRVRHAAEYLGMPWRAISVRPRTARLFYRRVETEMRAQAFKTIALAAIIE